MANNSYTKPPNGDWGVSSEKALSPGDTVKVTKRDGSTKMETIAALVATVGPYKRYSIVQTARGSSPARRAPSGPANSRTRPRYDGVRGCADCSRLGRMCSSCRFDEYDN